MAKKAKILDLRPTQMTLGLFYVGQNLAEFSGLKKGRLKRLIREHPVPVVRGPGKALWMIDRHHFCRALSDMDVEEVRIDIVVDASRLEPDEFVVWIDKMALIHPYDANGDRHDFADLPRHVGELVDDPYRTLAGMVREAGGYAKESRPFVEFLWADFLRRRIDSRLLDADLSKARRTALKLARSRQAGHLPGWSALT